MCPANFRGLTDAVNDALADVVKHLGSGRLLDLGGEIGDVLNVTLSISRSNRTLDDLSKSFSNSSKDRIILNGKSFFPNFLKSFLESSPSLFLCTLSPSTGSFSPYFYFYDFQKVQTLI